MIEKEILLFTNPLLNPIFGEVVLRMIIGCGAGFILIFILNKCTLKNIFESKLWNIYKGWLILIPLYCAGIFFGWITGGLIILSFIIIALWEVVKIANITVVYGYVLSLLAASTLFVAIFSPHMLSLFPLLYFALLCFTAVRSNDAEKGFYNSSVSLFAAIWIVFGLSHIALLAHLNSTLDATNALLFMVIFAVTLSDIGAYVFGKFFQKIGFLNQYTIASNISPNKTYIGIVGHVIGASVGVWAMWFAVGEYMHGYNFLILAVLIGVFGSIGGMINSLFKRYFHVKDSGALLAGHGGALDRIDSTIRVVVVVYYYFYFFM